MSSVQSEPRITPIGAFLQINESPDGKYTVKEVAATESALPKVVNDDDRKEISINVGFMALTGYVIPSTYEIGVEPSFLGIKFGNGFYGSLTKGLGINIDALAYHGHFNINKVGNDVVLKVDINGRFGLPSINETVKLLTL